MKILKLVLPTGSLQNATLFLFDKAGMRIFVDERSYRPTCEDKELEITLLRAQEIPKPVESGVFDCGITGYDWICERGVDVIKVAELTYSKSGFREVKWVVATKKSEIKSLKDLKGKKVATELRNVTEDFFKKKNIDVSVELSWGTTEALADFYDAIVELTETGRTLIAHGLRIIDTVLTSTPQFIANKVSWQDKWKKEKMENIVTLLKGALLAQSMVGLKMNLQKKDLPKVLKLLPALKKPTISNLTLKDWVAIEVVVEEKNVKDLLPELKRCGAQGIIEYPLNKVII